MAYDNLSFRPIRWQQRWEGGVESVVVMTATEVIDGRTPNILARDPGAADRVLTLPAEADANGVMFWILHDGAANTIDVQDDAAASVIALGPGQSALVACDGTAWAAFRTGEPMGVLADPGDAGAIPVTRSGSVAMVSAGAETRTVAIPSFVGQRLTLFHSVDGGAIVITFAAGINQANNATATFTEAADLLVLEAVDLGGALRWRVVANDGVVLAA